MHQCAPARPRKGPQTLGQASEISPAMAEIVFISSLSFEVESLAFSAPFFCFCCFFPSKHCAPKGVSEETSAGKHLGKCTFWRSLGKLLERCFENVPKQTFFWKIFMKQGK